MFSVSPSTRQPDDDESSVDDGNRVDEALSRTGDSDDDEVEDDEEAEDDVEGEGGCKIFQKNIVMNILRFILVTHNFHLYVQKI